jgi:hypothetical protein
MEVGRQKIVQVNTQLKNILAGLATAAIVANFATLYSFGERLARIETQLQLLTGHNWKADNNESGSTQIIRPNAA